MRCQGSTETLVPGVRGGGYGYEGWWSLRMKERRKGHKREEKSVAVVRRDGVCRVCTIEGLRGFGGVLRWVLATWMRRKYVGVRSCDHGCIEAVVFALYKHDLLLFGGGSCGCDWAIGGAVP